MAGSENCLSRFKILDCGMLQINIAFSFNKSSFSLKVRYCCAFDSPKIIQQIFTMWSFHFKLINTGSNTYIFWNRSAIIVIRKRDNGSSVLSNRPRFLSQPKLKQADRCKQMDKKQAACCVGVKSTKDSVANFQRNAIFSVKIQMYWYVQMCQVTKGWEQMQKIVDEVEGSVVSYFCFRLQIINGFLLVEEMVLRELIYLFGNWLIFGISGGRSYWFAG